MKPQRRKRPSSKLQTSNLAYGTKGTWTIFVNNQQQKN